MTPRVVGVDLSLTSTGLASVGPLLDSTRVQSKAPADASTAATLSRLRHIVREVVIWCSGDGDGIEDADLVVIEGPAYGTRRQGGEHVRAGLWWMLADQLVSYCGLPILVVTPAQRAMYATGKGNASKDAVLAAAIRRYPAWGITGNDVADAVILACIGARLLGHPVEESLPQTHLRALNKLALPTT